jgi:hypothetical protein
MEENDEMDIATLTLAFERMEENINTLNAVVACLLATVQREGIELAKPINITVN